MSNVAMAKEISEWNTQARRIKALASWQSWSQQETDADCSRKVPSVGKVEYDTLKGDV